MLRAIHIFPPIDILIEVERIREKYDPLYRKIQPHLTLVFPFNSTISTEELEHHVRSVTASFTPFHIVLQSVTASTDQYLYLNVKKGNDDVVALHDALYTGILKPYYNCRYSYVPHITVGKFENEADVQEALEETASFQEEIHVYVKTIVCEKIDDDGYSHIEFKVELKGRS